MESYKCRFCFKSFFNGRALGGHMRSHMTTSLHRFSFNNQQDQEEEEEKPSQLSYETESNLSSPSSSKEEIKKKNLNMGDDVESETDTSKNITNLTRKRSKRTRKLDSFTTKKTKTSQLGQKTKPEPLSEPEPHSSASDTTTEEDLAFCLMMLSRDQWKKNRASNEVAEENETEEEESRKMNRIITKGNRYKCETCGKEFKSYQALGGHRASHKKNRALSNKTEHRRETEYVKVKRAHECPICLRIFASGQALGGHKRSHGVGNLSVNHHNQEEARGDETVKQRMIDLNLPAPNEEEEVSVVFQ
ncbi:unnamed protein product [Cochlearia groenlandica]